MYNVRRNISLAAVIGPGNALELAPQHKRVGAVTVLRVTAGASFQLVIGTGNDPIPVPGAGVFYGFNPNKEGNLGAYLLNDTAQAGATCDILVGFVDDDASGATPRRSL